MEELMAMNQWLEALSVETGASLKLDETNRCYLEVNEIPCVLEVLVDEKRFLAYSPIASIPSTNDERTFYACLALALNVKQVCTGGPVLVLDSSSDELLLCQGENLEGCNLEILVARLNSLSSSAIAVSSLLNESVKEIKYSYLAPAAYVNKAVDDVIKNPPQNYNYLV